ncbi:MAG: hypothetical protein A2350_18285 [Candidatus Raymondbacteria bacterium RifOxyB12_full_50_8]|uniref:Carbohydrate-binding domain-containing protein n=1 Tax=Candidatus Raymondbacteria bacterium RIFOXYD12_FULL_49_13 TaxID=1817890 RepID=A0A1F7F716_UNCRA|nr:MAG: hypothetical protein A2248_00265 [Candidatus Raymondbacteria bacterium RIFOXYA2_FULL_49_16]OGJ96178.1 MAG: hypothetical protein A2453_05615 [Candidatus Raymondbacteria bacterium RIFOXYC2_FULL_50_21]OGJ99976.1 MAG: hypothetical protein A2350_18285 [Candidatus Raymondbacteria bacterium RifOxyB12_full_50_8]OGK02431.1 MAG: hypothetical protein A2519_14545 [Candidatus Raymondbacteria bacterium RIFOXYD12_FULL_49_13]OGP41269.1 MAG: hypothetical protein A2324_16745 [Candidatus Raymondbacteria b
MQLKQALEYSAFPFLLCFSLVLGQGGDTIRVYKTNKPPVIDGTLADWDRAYCIGGFTGEKNHALTKGSWKGFAKDYQCETYACHDDSFMYIGWKTLVDDESIVGRGWEKVCGDNIKLCLGGWSDVIYLWNDTVVPGRNPEYMNFNYHLKVGITRGKLPVYEIRIPKQEIRLYYDGSPPYAFMNIMTEDYDNKCSEYDFWGIGFTLPDSLDKRDDNWNQWENPWYFPVFLFYNTIPVQRK